MEANASADHNMYEDFEPFCVWHRFADCEIFEVHLRGFKKENLRVQVTNNNVLSVTGELPLSGGSEKRSRFKKNFELSNDINKKEIRAKLGGTGTLSLVMPKKLNLIQNPKDNDGGSKQEGRNNGADVSSRAMTFRDGIAMKLMNCKKMAPLAVVVVLAAIVVGFGAFLAQKYSPKLPF